MKKYEDKSNITGKIIKEERIKQNLSKSEVCRKLQFYAVYIDNTELHRMETGKMIIKDFELIALCKVLNIDYKKIDGAIVQEE